MLSYELKDPGSYKNIGGAYVYMLGVERENPAYPGLLLEKPKNLKDGNYDISYFRASEIPFRFKNRIFYQIMLDTCGDIHDESFKIFKQLFESKIVIE